MTSDVNAVGLIVLHLHTNDPTVHFFNTRSTACNHIITLSSVKRRSRRKLSEKLNFLEKYAHAKWPLVRSIWHHMAPNVVRNSCPVDDTLVVPYSTPAGPWWHQYGIPCGTSMAPLRNQGHQCDTTAMAPLWHKYGTRGPNRGHIFAKGGSIYIKSTPEWSALQHNSRLSSFSLEHNIIYLFNDVQ